MEAVDDKAGTTIIENSLEGSYTRRFKRWYREQFKKNQKVRVPKNENLQGVISTEKKVLRSGYSN